MGKFTSEIARLAGQKSRRGPAKKNPIIHDAMEILLTEGMAKLYEKIDELNVSQLLKLVQISANYVLPKAKPQDDRFTQEFKDNRSMDWGKSKTDFLGHGIFLGSSGLGIRFGETKSPYGNRSHQAFLPH